MKRYSMWAQKPNRDWCKWEDVEKLMAENARLREALEFYATMENWYIRFGGLCAITTTGTSACDADGGHIAREALEEK